MGKAVTKKDILEDKVEFFDVEQRSPEWHELRRGMVTTSKLAIVIATGRNGGDSAGRDKYRKLLVGERITGNIAETFQNEAMQRGVRVEPEALTWYEQTRLVDLKSVGFVKRTVRVPLGSDFVIGSSPDSQISPRKGLEIKSLAPHLLVDIKIKGAAGFPSEHKAQLQGTMWVCGWDEMDLVLFSSGWPKPPVFTIERDDIYIARLKDEVERFDYELRRLVDQCR